MAKFQNPEDAAVVEAVSKTDQFFQQHRHAGYSKTNGNAQQKQAPRFHLRIHRILLFFFLDYTTNSR